MSKPPAESLAAVDPQGIGLEVAFHRHGDRYGHTIARVAGGQSQVTWQSQTGDDQALALQELHSQRQADGSTLLLLSGAGAGAHWSMSVHRSGPQSLCFDVAARVSRSPTDRVLQYVAAATADGKAVDWAMLVGELVADGRTTTIYPSPSPTDSPPLTLRWKYTVTVVVGG